MDAPSAPPSPRAVAPDVPASSPARLFTAPTTSGRFVVWLPPLLLVVSWLLGLMTVGFWLTAEQITWALVPTGVLLVLRALLEALLARTGPGSPALGVLYVLHLLLLVVLTALNPLASVYAFVGYLDGPRFVSGAAVPAVLVATAFLSALGQVGGPASAASVPLIYGGLVAVNLLIAGAMSYLSWERERTIAQREEALAERDRTAQDNARLQQELVDRAHDRGVSAERERLSREIHDTVAQGLVGVIRQLEAVGDGLGAAEGERVRRAEEAARDCLVEARRAVEALSPHQLDGARASEALGGIVARWARTHRVVATFDADDAPAEVAHGPVMLRVAQEALANVARHAGAGTVAVTFGSTARGQLLRVQDDGRGFSASTAVAGHGLQNMRERLREVGGTLTVTSAPGEGCTVSAEVPR
ncbi:sensor histidine kinase [Brachybacterium sp. NBEC-018]|uniref:sensor histidine kinase n=1 Tax=Brachybacterium sp. NBEC-018 TaxID=2996004 RepID=UPI0021751789|nr:sensor histidine kinase [Brachybacterium sp. NBEC-018]UVY83001.1 sensor histidine kinase [Brachybacterium sp. NBEC-018]